MTQFVCVTAPNAGPFTHLGTNSYIIGRDSVAVIDPGPDDDRHLLALLNTIGTRPVSHIFVTHTHIDHSPLAKKLSARTGARTVGVGPHRFLNSASTDTLNGLDASADFDFEPAISVTDGQTVDCGDFRITTITTPGHAENHAAYAIEESGILFSGDHVMDWSTTIVAPPDGSMQSYIDSLDKLLNRSDRQYLPGHGGQINNPHQRVRALKAHRLQREAAILDQVRRGRSRLKTIVEAVYATTDPRLHPAAALTTMAHLERLRTFGRISIHGTNGFDAYYTALAPSGS